MTWLASIISHSKSVSSTNVSRILSQIPLSRHRQNRRCTFFRFPYVSGKSRQGAPVRRIQNTPLINRRVSRALPPRVPFSPMVYGLILSHALSLMSCRRCSPAIFLSSLPSSGLLYHTFIDDTIQPVATLFRAWSGVICKIRSIICNFADLISSFRTQRIHHLRFATIVPENSREDRYTLYRSSLFYRPYEPFYFTISICEVNFDII